MRIGHGFDAHRFEAARKLIIGGVDIPYDKGLAAHSDGDVLIHAICDALLGALGFGDIGKHFPDSSKEFEGIDSRILLRKVGDLLTQEGFVVGNIDATIVAQKPKIAPYVPQMRECLASDLKLAVRNINIKGTTTEGMGFTGREEGIAAHAVALLLPVVTR